MRRRPCRAGHPRSLEPAEPEGVSPRGLRAGDGPGFSAAINPRNCGLAALNSPAGSSSGRNAWGVPDPLVTKRSAWAGLRATGR